MKRLASLDPGLATFGLVLLDLSPMYGGSSHAECVAAAAFKSEPATETAFDDAMVADRVRRTRDLQRWLSPFLDSVDIVAAEAMSFPRGAIPISMISLAWGVICGELEARSIPLVAAFPTTWRSHLVGKGKRGGTEKQRKARTQAREDAAHAKAVARVPSFAQVARSVTPTLQAHVLDALGVGVWSLSTPQVRRIVG